MRVWYDGKWNDSEISNTCEKLHYWTVINNYLSNEECDKIVKAREYWIPEDGRVYDSDNVQTIDRDQRSVTTYVMDCDFDWIGDKVWSTVQRLNTRHWKFDLEGYLEKPTLLEYNAPFGHYNWHMDIGNRPLTCYRKLTFIILLNDEFEGGDLKMYHGGNHFQATHLVKGSLIVFPSYLMHTVEEITGGNRFAVIGWVSGNSFN